MCAVQSPVPLTIVTGFLGSGKTTMINFLLAEVGDRVKLAIVKNEIGDVPIDSKIIRGKNIVMRELLNGCVCCTLVGALEESLQELVQMVQPDRIIIEASGAANPAILAVNIDRMIEVKRDLIVTVVDVLHFDVYHDKTIVGRLQQKFTDLVVLNRVGDVDEQTMERVLDEVYEVRPGIPVVKTKTGRINPDVLFGVRNGKESIVLSGLDRTRDLHEGHLEEDEIDAFPFRTDRPLNRDCFEKVLSGLSEEYYRVKGFVQFTGSDAPLLVNFVCGRYEFNEVELADKPGDMDKTEIVFVGKNIKRYEKKVTERLAGCCE